MEQNLTGIIVNTSKNFQNKIITGLISFVEIVKTIETLSDGYQYLRNHKPGMVFMDVTTNAKDCMKIVGLMLKKEPDTMVFLIDDGKDPDIILEGFRTGATDFLIPGFTGADVAACVKNGLKRSSGMVQKAEVFTVFSLKGGLGVTTLAINLADHIYDITKGKILLLDLNLFMGDITSYLDIVPSFTPYDLVGDMDRMDKQLLFSSLFRHDCGFFVLTTPEEINDSDSISGQDIFDMISLLKGYFDYIVVDSPHDFSERTLKLLPCTDRLLVMVQQSIPSAKSVQKVIEFLNEIDFKPDGLNIVLNRHLKKNEFKIVDLERILSGQISFVLENDYPLFIQAANKGATLNSVAKNSRINQQINQMAAGLTGIKPVPEKKWKNLLFKKKNEIK
ncbi:MAG: hypothetical protein K8S13_08160 [Desulfobacula sp.]|uniref:hypothetical protein n=1 Tax=Desulfobacula sp. TaxID=2593537 RepID=UPI0025C63E5A|nr:hypothetical protein [Desulfobacula sp.]MCD4719820.1 hypothetical protein [Desulfobacula sp.]